MGATRDGEATEVGALRARRVVGRVQPAVMAPQSVAGRAAQSALRQSEACWFSHDR